MSIIYQVQFYFQAFILNCLTSGALGGSAGCMLRSQYSGTTRKCWQPNWAYTNLYVVFSSKNPDKMGMKYTCNQRDAELPESNCGYFQSSRIPADPQVEFYLTYLHAVFTICISKIPIIQITSGHPIKKNNQCISL